MQPMFSTEHPTTIPNPSNYSLNFGVGFGAHLQHGLSRYGARQAGCLDRTVWQLQVITTSSRRALFSAHGHEVCLMYPLLASCIWLAKDAQRPRDPPLPESIAQCT